MPVVMANGVRLGSSGVRTYDSGDVVTLTCLAEGSPTPQYTWSKIQPGGGFVQLRSGGNVQISGGTLG